MSDYEADILVWTEHQAALLRRRAAGELVNEADLDWTNIAEEIESVGRSERSVLSSRVRTIIEHLAKLEASPASKPRIGWQETVLRCRADIDALLQATPSLRRELDETVANELGRALRLAAASMKLHCEAPRIALEDIRFSSEQVLGPWFPGSTPRPSPRSTAFASTSRN
ncbi:DUF29 domain-containing protein [Rhodopila sp.]|uniref:DUF29 domain-containing protein n=1 Tax=Rhodopila sp. TaxID=2480087 RepID=UPI003D09B2FC